ncbi:hypothetical protein ACWWD9_07060 [Methylovorus sp. SPW-M1]
MKLLPYLILLILSSVTFAAGKTAEPKGRLEANLGPGCHIAATMPITKGVDTGLGDAGFRVEPLPASWKSNMGEMYFSLNCRDLDDPRVAGKPLPLKYDESTGHWTKDMSDWIKYAQSLPDQFDRDSEFENINATDILHIDAINSKGWAMTQKDTIGEERGRRHSMSFCLLHPPKAICGAGVTGYLADPKSDLTERALEIIRTIEFLPDVPAAEPVKP